MIGCFVEVCKRKGLKLNADKNEVMKSRGDRGWEYRHLRPF